MLSGWLTANANCQPHQRFVSDYSEFHPKRKRAGDIFHCVNGLILGEKQGRVRLVPPEAMAINTYLPTLPGRKRMDASFVLASPGWLTLSLHILSAHPQQATTPTV